MANLTESPIYEPGIFQLEKTTPPLGGAPAFNGSNPSAGHANVQALQLANRTAWLKEQIDAGGSASSLQAALASSTDPLKGASLVGWDNSTVAQFLNTAKSLSTLADLRGYTGSASVINILEVGFQGLFYLDNADTTSLENGGTVVVSSTGKRWKRYFTGPVDVRWFGAMGDGTSRLISSRFTTLSAAQAIYPHVISLSDEIDWVAIQAAINFALTRAPVDFIFLGRGNYILNRQLVATQTIGIGGLGQEQTQLTWRASSVSQGISLTYTSTTDKSHPLIENMSFVRDSAYGGTAIYINGATGGGHPDSFRGFIQNVRCDRAQRGSGTGSWEYGIRCVNVAGMVIDVYSFQGDVNPTDPTRYYGTPWLIEGPDGVNEVNSHFYINNTFCVYAEYGGKASNCEELHLYNFTYYNVEYGVWYDNVGNYDENVVSPRIEIGLGHIKARRIGAYFKKAQASGIRDIYFLHSNADTPVGTTYKHVQLDGCLNNTVRDLKIEGLNGSTATGIELINSSFENVIEGINFFTSGGDAIHLDSTSQANYIGVNAFRSSSWARYLFNESLYAAYLHGIFTLRTDSTVSFPNGSLSVPFSSVYRGELGTGWADLGTTPTRITIRKRGKYRVTAHVRITAASGGIRTAAIWVNGNSGVGLGRISTAAAPTGDTWLSVISDVLTLNATDYLTLYLEQTSGSTLNVASGTVLSIEFLGAA